MFLLDFFSYEVKANAILITVKRFAVISVFMHC